MLEVTGRRGRRRKQLRHEHYCQDATVFRTGYINEYFNETSTEGKIEEMLEVTGKRGRRRKQPRHEHYCQDATVFRTVYINEYFNETSLLKERLKKYKK